MRTPLWLAPLVLGACATARPAAARSSAPVQYRVDLTHGATQYVHVEARIPSRSASTTLALPAWTPGSYKIRDFGKHVYGLTATAANGAALGDDHAFGHVQIETAGQLGRHVLDLHAQPGATHTSVVEQQFLLGGQIQLFQQFRPSRRRPAQCLLQAPAANLFVIAAE